jgi:hypothetical protein
MPAWFNIMLVWNPLLGYFLYLLSGFLLAIKIWGGSAINEWAYVAY